jgi:hypothetical protein
MRARSLWLRSVKNPRTGIRIHTVASAGVRTSLHVRLLRWDAPPCTLRAGSQPLGGSAPHRTATIAWAIIAWAIIAWAIIAWASVAWAIIGWQRNFVAGLQLYLLGKRLV